MSLVSYEKMKAHYESVKPIRGTEIKPFKIRRRKHERMEMLKNGDIQIICYNTPVLTIHPDDSFSVCHGGWVTNATSNFIHYVFHMMGWRGTVGGVFKYDNQLWLPIWNIERGDWVRMPITKDPIRYAFDPDSRMYKPEANPIVPKLRTRINKAQKKVMEQKCAAFLDWLKAFGKLLDNQNVSDDAQPWDYEIRCAINYPTGLREGSRVWYNEKSRPFLEAIVTGTDEKKYMEFLAHASAGHKFPSIFNFKRDGRRVMHILRCMFGVYTEVKVEVEYEMNRKTKW